jgi:hypothetical protein
MRHIGQNGVPPLPGVYRFPWLSPVNPSITKLVVMSVLNFAPGKAGGPAAQTGNETARNSDNAINRFLFLMSALAFLCCGGTDNHAR